MRVLDFETIRELSKNIAPSEYYDWIDYTLKNKNYFQMPIKSRLSQDNGNYYAVMPSLYEHDNIAAVKMIGRHLLRENEQRATMMSDMLLYEADSGILKAVMDAEYLTTIRTGAAAAHAALLYGKSDFKTIGLIGLGNIMTACMMILLEKTKDRTLTLKLYKHHCQEDRFVNTFKKYDNVEFVFCDTYEETINNSDIIISAVTKVTENFCSDECYKKGCTVIPIMTMGFQNCDLFFDHIFTDEIEQIRDFKYFNRFKKINNTTDVLNKLIDGRTSDSERILVYNYGLANYDLYFAYQFYKLSNEEHEVEYNFCKEKYFM